MSRVQGWWQGLLGQITAVPPNIRRFFITVLAYGATVEGINAVLLNLYLLRLGYGTEFIGTLNSAGLFVFALVSLPIGAVQRYSSRQMLQMGHVVSLVGLLGLPLAQYAPFGEAALLIAFRILAMVGLSAYFVHQLPFAMEITRPEWHNRVLAWTMAAFSMAAFLGSWVGGMLPALFSNWLALSMSNPRVFQLPMLLANILIIPAILAIHFIPDDEKLGFSQNEAPPQYDYANWRSIAGLVVIILVIRAMQTSGVGVVMTFSNVYFDDALQVPTGRIGFISGIGRLLGVPMSLVIPWLMSRYGSFKLVHISLGLIILLMLPLALIAYWPIAAVALISINSMGSLRYLSFITFTMSLVSEKQRSLISGVGEMAIGSGFAISSFVGGYLIAWYGYRELFLFGAALTLIGATAFWLVFRRQAEVLAKMPAPVPN